MLEETASVPSRDNIERPAHRFYQSLAGACLELPQCCLHFGKGLLDGIETGRVGRQVEKLASLLLDQLAHPPALVHREVVHHHDLPRPERGRQHPLQISFEHLPRRSAFDC
jgi:hypothetical protein